MGSADVIMSPVKPADGGFISDLRKKHDVGAVKSSANTKTARTSRTPMYGVRNASLPVVPKRAKT